MNTINLEDQNQIDDLHIQRAIAGLSDLERTKLRELVSDRCRYDGEDGGSVDSIDSELEDFTDFDQCVALVDVWLAGNSGVSLNSDQRRRLLDRFAGGTPDRNIESKHRRRLLASRRWIWASTLAAAVICCVFASMAWFNQPTETETLVRMSASELRKQMLANPPVDMLRWVWQGGSEADNGTPFLGDVIWSDGLQQGYALMNVSSPIADSTLYQLQLFQMLEDELEQGVLCGEFRFDGYSAPFVVTIRPNDKVSKPNRFTVARSPDEPAETAGPNEIEEVTLVAQADVIALPEDNAVVSDDNAVISNGEPASF